MRIVWILFLLLCIKLLAQPFTNALIDEESPYLQQHAHNPIEWLPWSDETFAKAKAEHKPIFLSIGYSTCHWCHVMARESFENEMMAKIFNQHFISIKVDREEMPQIDSYYQNIYQKVRHRSGGWPLTIIMNEDREPFFITTYIPNIPKYGVDGLDTTLLKYATMHAKDKKEMNKRVKAIKAVVEKKVEPVDKRHQTVGSIFKAVNDSYDKLYIGFDISPKFPEASKIELLFVLSELGFPQAKTMALDVLRTMALRGLYDHVDGGFFRYCVDANWEIPHFEKMLYNQAELIPLYVKAYQITKDKLYHDIVTETIAMVYDRFEKNGLFYSASNADVDHEEGKYFIYSVNEISDALQRSDKSKSIHTAMEFRSRGNFENKIHLGFYSNKRPEGFSSFQTYLKELRHNREYPFIDKKIITSWNAMMIEALFDASVINSDYGVLAQISLENLSNLLEKKETLYHQSYNRKTPYIKGLLEDYAAMISLYIKAYEKSYKTQYLDRAEQLVQRALLKFYNNGVWYLNEDKPKISVDLKDKYYTSAIGVMLQNLQRLAAINGSFALQDIAKKSLNNITDELFHDPAYGPSSAIAFLMQSYGVVSIKHQKKILQAHQDEIGTIEYPFLVTKASDDKEFLACRVGQCFSYSKNFFDVKKNIEKTLLIK